MLSDTEKARMRDVEKATHAATQQFVINLDIVSIDGVDNDSDFGATIAGMLMAVADALFAIRDGDPWRGIVDPHEIAGQLLREVQLGDPK